MSSTDDARQEARLDPPVGRELLTALVDAFLSWPLPDSVCSDGCVTERGAPHRTGTNLLTADEARQMFEHVLAAASAEPKCRICDNTGWNHYAQPGPGAGYKTVRCKCAIGTPNAG